MTEEIELRTDFENLEDHDDITLYPNHTNLLHKKPVKATFAGGYYYCQGTPPVDGPDYYWRDVGQYNEGFTKP